MWLFFFSISVFTLNVSISACLSFWSICRLEPSWFAQAVFSHPKPVIYFRKPPRNITIVIYSPFAPREILCNSVFDCYVLQEILATFQSRLHDLFRIQENIYLTLEKKKITSVSHTTPLKKTFSLL